MKEYTTLGLGRYGDTPIDKLDMKYLVWFFRSIQKGESHRELRNKILEYLLTKSIRIETVNEQKYLFYFNDINFPAVGGGQRPFMFSSWKMKNSDDEDVYQIGKDNEPVFIKSSDTGLSIITNIKVHTYKFGGTKIVYETNPDWYFMDNNGKYYIGAYLLREPLIPNNEKGWGFSKNLQIENLSK